MVMIAIYTGKEITKLREALGMSPTEFAAKLGVSQSAVTRWEMGNRVPRVQTLIKMNALAKRLSRQPA